MGALPSIANALRWVGIGIPQGVGGRCVVVSSLLDGELGFQAFLKDFPLLS
jgi:hypothetical protein